MCISCPERGGALSIFVLRGCAVFKGIVFTYFSLNRVSKEGKFSGAGCQNMSKEEILLQRANFWSNFFFEYTFQRFFSRTGCHLKEKILEQGEIFCRGHIPVQI